MNKGASQVSKVIQIAILPESRLLNATLYVLREDGTVLFQVIGKKEWHKVALPQSESRE